ncbi:MAG: response regulator [Planctomycetaceae bacterium]|nr:response regulator [Planctomycetaceae bacterium]
MPIVLIVDDSEVDRRLVGGLLPKDLDWLVEFADNGVEALEKMRLSLPDVVITDMMMPEMDGMELVSNISMDYPHIPVILITGHGNESLAVEALEKGATSYVPKQFLADKLQETVEQVLAVSKADRSYSRLFSRLQNTQYRFALDNDPALIPPLVDLLQQTLADMRCCDATGRMHAGIALEEAMFNAMLAGNLEMDREQVLEARGQLRQGYVSQLVKERRSQEPYAGRVTEVKADISLDQAVFIIRDQGSGFDIARVPNRHDPETLDQLEGRGLVLMMNFMDEVRFNEVGNEVTMVMRCRRDCAVPPVVPNAPGFPPGFKL